MSGWLSTAAQPVADLVSIADREYAVVVPTADQPNDVTQNHLPTGGVTSEDAQKGVAALISSIN